MFLFSLPLLNCFLILSKKVSKSVLWKCNGLQSFAHALGSVKRLKMSTNLMMKHMRNFLWMFFACRRGYKFMWYNTFMLFPTGGHGSERATGTPGASGTQSKWQNYLSLKKNKKKKSIQGDFSACVRECVSAFMYEILEKRHEMLTNHWQESNYNKNVHFLK